MDCLVNYQEKSNEQSSENFTQEHFESITCKEAFACENDDDTMHSHKNKTKSTETENKKRDNQSDNFTGKKMQQHQQKTVCPLNGAGCFFNITIDSKRAFLYRHLIPIVFF